MQEDMNDGHQWQSCQVDDDMISLAAIERLLDLGSHGGAGDVGCWAGLPLGRSSAYQTMRE